MQAQQEQQIDFASLDEYIDKLEDRRGALIAVLHKAQSLYGYLPRSVQAHIARRLSVPSAKVFGVVTFYSFLKQEPRGKVELSVCLGTACFVRGSEAVMRELEQQLGVKSGGMTEDGMFSLESIRCVGACGLAPVVMAGEQVYGRVSPEDVRGIIDEQLAKEGMKDGRA